jgi:hypothetical protein
MQTAMIHVASEGWKMQTSDPLQIVCWSEPQGEGRCTRRQVVIKLLSACTPQQVMKERCSSGRHGCMADGTHGLAVNSLVAITLVNVIADGSIYDIISSCIQIIVATSSVAADREERRRYTSASVGPLTAGEGHVQVTTRVAVCFSQLLSQ